MTRHETVTLAWIKTNGRPSRGVRFVADVADALVAHEVGML